MQSLVVLLAVVSVACGSYIAQPLHHPALVLDPHGRPLDTAEVINARAIHLQAKALEYSPIAHTAVVAPIATAAVAPVVTPVAHAVLPSAVSHQSRVDVRTSPAVVTHSLASPLLAHSALGLVGHGHYLKKRSLGHLAYAAPLIAPTAVSHQSRVDVVSSPAVVSHAVATPVVSHVAAPVLAHAVAAPVLAPAAVSHQSRVDVRTSPAVYGHGLASPLWAHSALGLAGHGHYLAKRSLGHLAYAVHAPASAVSHQSRVDVVSSPAVVSHAVAAPVLAHAVAAPVLAPAAVSHQSRVDVRTSPAVAVSYAAPLAHSYAATYAAPLHYTPALYGHGLHY